MRETENEEEGGEGGREGGKEGKGNGKGEREIGTHCYGDTWHLAVLLICCRVSSTSLVPTPVHW